MNLTTPKRWIAKGYDKLAAQRLSQSLGVSAVVAGLLISRGMTDVDAARATLHPSHDQLHEPLLMDGMKTAVARILRAVDAGERILVYGDYDVDGTTGTVVLRRALHLLGAQTGFHIPHRFTEGYGIRQEALQQAQADGYTLVISVDCGIRAHEPLQWARDHNLDCIITDHHLPSETEGTPPALAVLNPNKAGCPYPDKNLAGVGVAFKLAHALLRERGRENLVNSFLKMVAIGTVADIAPLVGENRAIVALGLADLPKATNHGLRALMEVAGVGVNGNGSNGGSAHVSASDLGFRLGPRINAAGRMDAASAVVELFEAETMEQARRLATLLDARNRERQSMQKEIVALALAELEASATGADGEARETPHVHVIAGDDWHRGVIGLAASKLSERSNRPCIVISLDGDTGHGSARSIEAYHLLDGLTSCAELFERFGGHAHAAGLVINRAQIPELRRRLHDHAAARLTPEDFQPVINLDAELEAGELSLALARELSCLEPFGAGWRSPLFATRNLRVVTEPLVMKEKHLKLRLADADDANGNTLEAVWWNCLENNRTATPARDARIELAYSLELNHWQGTTRLQLVVQDLKER